MLQNLKTWFDSIRYRRLRAHKWRRFCFLRQAVESGADASLELLLKRLGYSPRSGLLEDWFTCFCAQAGEPLSAATEQKMRTCLDAVPASELPGLAWLDLYRLLFGLGYFSAALPLREKALVRFVADAMEKQASLGCMEHGLAALVDQGHWTEAEALLVRMDAMGFPPGRSAFATWLIGLFSGKLSGQLSPSSLPGSFFTQLVRGKQVALVGPVPSSAGSGPDIDAFDLVAKFNYRGGDKGRDPLMQGQRIDIAYYNLEQSRVFSRQAYLPVFEALSAVVFIKRKAVGFFAEKVEQVRCIERFDWLLMDSELNVGPNAMLDCLAAGASKITIFNTDLMLTAGRADGYRPAGLATINYLRSFVKTHDPVMQYNIFRHAWDAGLIDGDDAFRAVMQMGLDEYIRQLAVSHGR